MWCCKKEKWRFKSLIDIGKTKKIAKHIVDGNVITEEKYLLSADYNGNDEIKMNDVVQLLKEAK